MLCFFNLWPAVFADQSDASNNGVGGLEHQKTPLNDLFHSVNRPIIVNATEAPVKGDGDQRTPPVNPEAALLKRMFSHYNPNAKPKPLHGKPINVDITFSLGRIVALVTQLYIVSCILYFAFYNTAYNTEITRTTLLSFRIFCNVKGN